jgi:glycosyltransferase involved in cell wall biosynthesis
VTCCAVPRRSDTRSIRANRLDHDRIASRSSADPDRNVGIGWFARWPGRCGCCSGIGPTNTASLLQRSMPATHPAIPQLDATNTVAVVISFEGPDSASQAGGLGVRVTGLVRTLATQGFETHLFFMGDPRLPGEERVNDSRLVLHRWCQWISQHHPGGVYDGEEEKRNDLNASLPSYVVDRILLPAIRAGGVPVVLLEEWQTAECASLIADQLTAQGVRDRAVILWNANNAYSFDRIDWPRLASTTTITAVSRYMRSIIRTRGVDALVVPNGIPRRLTFPVSRSHAAIIRALFGETPFFFKMARRQRDTGWTQALDALRGFRARGTPAILVARAGGPGGPGSELDAEAEARGLRVRQVEREDWFPTRIREAVHTGDDILNLRFGVPESLARSLFLAADGVLANSVSEPFGLVALEAMAAGGLVYTGGMGDDYAVSGQNAVVLDTLEPTEIVDRADELARCPDRALRIRRAARLTARDYDWSRVTTDLLGLIADQARRQRVVSRPAVDDRYSLSPLASKPRRRRERAPQTLSTLPDSRMEALAR